MTKREINKFRSIIYGYYKKHRRDLPWRKNITPYKIVVSEIMLQQTQVDRCIPKFNTFIKRFPNFKALAKAPLSEVLKVWNGLGYNRRAVYLKRIADAVGAIHELPLPRDPDELKKFPGIGPATAASIVVYAFNKPYPFIETNVRSVFIHHFFNIDYADTKWITQISDRRRGRKFSAPTTTDLVHDTDILPLVEATLDRKNPREWYYALMDYAVMLKKQHKNPSRRSAHYVRQSKFEGSNRQLRGRIVKALLEHPSTSHTLSKLLNADEKLVRKNLTTLVAEGLVSQREKLTLLHKQKSVRTLYSRSSGGIKTGGVSERIFVADLLRRVITEAFIRPRGEGGEGVPRK